LSDITYLPADAAISVYDGKETTLKCLRQTRVIEQPVLFKKKLEVLGDLTFNLVGLIGTSRAILGRQYSQTDM
jgi:hypothetical protein